MVDRVIVDGRGDLDICIAGCAESNIVGGTCLAGESAEGGKEDVVYGVYHEAGGTEDGDIGGLGCDALY